MGTGDPQQAQEADNGDLADDGIAVYHEGDTTAHQGCFDQIGHSHTTTFLIVTTLNGAARLQNSSESVLSGVEVISLFFVAMQVASKARFVRATLRPFHVGGLHPGHGGLWGAADGVCGAPISQNDTDCWVEK